jgi:hypothetical protein
MFGNLGLHVLKTPAGTYSYVGSVPTVLAEIVPADRAAVLGNRAWIDKEQDKIMMYKFPVFATAAEAVAFAASKGLEARQ